MYAKIFKNGYECKLRSSTEGLQEQAEQSTKIDRRELAKSDMTRGSQTKNGPNPEYALVRSCMNCSELNEPADLSLTGDVPSIDTNLPPFPVHPLLGWVVTVLATRENHFYLQPLYFSLSTGGPSSHAQSEEFYASCTRTLGET